MLFVGSTRGRLQIKWNRKYLFDAILKLCDMWLIALWHGFRLVYKDCCLRLFFNIDTSAGAVLKALVISQKIIIF